MPSLGFTDVDATNRALVLLGEETIDSLTDDDDLSETCATIYPMARDEVLGKYPWRCLMKFAQLGQLTGGDAPPSGWLYAYQLPTDRVGELRTVWNTSETGAKPFKEFDIVGDKLYTDATEIWAEYPYLINEDAFPAHLRTLLVFVLAARLAEPITEDQAKAVKWETEAYGTPGEGGMGGYFSRARLIDSQQRPSQEIASGTDYELINCRM